MRLNINGFWKSVVILICLFFSISSQAQIEVLRAINYQQITEFETNMGISSMKISGDGSVIVFGTSGAQVKVYVIGSDGTDLTEIFDYERAGSGPWVDISGDGNTLIWCDGYGEIYISDKGGVIIDELVTLIPNPNPDFADIVPSFPVPPRINSYGTQVFFIATSADPAASGLYRVNASGASLTQIFNYLDVAEDVYGTDGSEYDRNVAFADGFDISGNGDYAIFGNRIFQIMDGELEKGDAIVFYADQFTKISSYATGIQPFCTYVDGDRYLVFRREDNPDTQMEEVNLYALNIGGGVETKLLEGLSVTSYPQMTMMAGSGVEGIVLAGGGLPFTPPITYVSSNPVYTFDLVNVDNVSVPTANFSMSSSMLPSITYSSNMFCFLSSGYPSQIWIGNIVSGPTLDDPFIYNVLIDPTEVMFDGSSTTHIEAKIISNFDTVHTVAMNAFYEGVYQFRAFTSNPPFMRLVDDGTLGDSDAGDNYYTNNTVRTDLITSPIGDYTLRIAVSNSSLMEITAADYFPLSIVTELSDPSYEEKVTSDGFSLTLTPNPFSDNLFMQFNIPEGDKITLDILNLQGQIVKRLLYDVFIDGVYTMNWNGEGMNNKPLPAGIYFCRIKAKDKMHIQKVFLLRP